LKTLQKISIITPTFNSGKFLTYNLLSVKKQNFSNYEHIIVDNCSSDNTLETIKNFDSKKIKIISEADNGIYDAINKGIKLSSGDIISILHSDDEYFDENVLSKIENAFKNYQTEIVYGNLIYTSNENINKTIRTWKSSDYIANNFKRGWNPPHPSFFVKKRLHEEYGYYLPELGNSADIELMFRLLEIKTIKSKFLNEFFVKMRLGGKSNNSIMQILKQNITIVKFLKLNRFGIIKFFILKLFNRLKQFI